MKFKQIKDGDYFDSFGVVYQKQTVTVQEMRARRNAYPLSRLEDDEYVQCGYNIKSYELSHFDDNAEVTKVSF